MKQMNYWILKLLTAVRLVNRTCCYNTVILTW